MGDIIKLYINSIRIYIYKYTHIIYIMYKLSIKQVGVSCKLICHRKCSSNFHSTVLRIYSHGGWLMAMLSLSIGYLALGKPTTTDPTHGTSRGTDP